MPEKLLGASLTEFTQNETNVAQELRQPHSAIKEESKLKLS